MIKPGNPAPRTGPGTAETVIPELLSWKPVAVMSSSPVNVKPKGTTALVTEEPTPSKGGNDAEPKGVPGACAVPR